MEVKMLATEPGARSSKGELLISVVIPTCHRPDLLSSCLDRLAPGVQTFPANLYEVVVSDDGEPTIDELLAERYPWATCLKGPRKGPAANHHKRRPFSQSKMAPFPGECLRPRLGRPGAERGSHPRRVPNLRRQNDLSS